MLLSLPVCRCHASKEGMMFHAFLPKVFAMISVLEVKFDRVFIVPLKSRNKSLLTHATLRGRQNTECVRDLD